MGARAPHEGIGVRRDMGVNEAAAEVLRSVGGKRNVLANSLCMTRLRIRVANPTIVDKKADEIVKKICLG